MPKTRQLWTRFAKGELSPLFEGSPDLAAYFEGASILENFQILRSGGITRHAGLVHVADAKYADSPVILLPFVFSSSVAYILEIGHRYMRVFRGHAPVLRSGTPVECETPWFAEDIATLQVVQSADVMFVFHRYYDPRKILRLAEDVWRVEPVTFTPPPSIEDGTRLPIAIGITGQTGTVTIRAADDLFLAGDVGRPLVYQDGSAIITALTNARQVQASVITPFALDNAAGPGTITTTGTSFTTSTTHGLTAGNFIMLTSGPQSGEIRFVASITGPSSGTLDTAFSANQTAQAWNRVGAIEGWVMESSPQTTLDPNAKRPVGRQVTLTAGANAFRSNDVGRFVHLYEGIVEITSVTSATVATGIIRQILSGSSSDDPPPVAAGAWTLESSSLGGNAQFPKAATLYQGRLYMASTALQPTTLWGSRSDGLVNFGRGITADAAIEHQVQSSQVNEIRWLASIRRKLYIGTSGAELSAEGSGNTNAVIGGNTIPLITVIGTIGSAQIQPAIVQHDILFVDRSYRKLLRIASSPERESETTEELTILAEHITAPAIAPGPIGVAVHPDPRLYLTRTDGQLVCITYFPEQKIIAASRRTTPSGAIISAAVIPGDPEEGDVLWVAVRRHFSTGERVTIERQTVRHPSLIDHPRRRWASVYLDSASILTNVVGTTITGLDRFSGMEVGVVVNEGYRGTFPVIEGAVTLPEPVSASDVLEIGLPYTSTVKTFRPAVPQANIEGIPRAWDSLCVRLYQTVGGELNGVPLPYAPEILDNNVIFTGDVRVHPLQWSLDGRVTISQPQPYPMTVLAVFGTLSMGDHD